MTLRERVLTGTFLAAAIGFLPFFGPLVLDPFYAWSRQHRVRARLVVALYGTCTALLAPSTTALHVLHSLLPPSMAALVAGLLGLAILAFVGRGVVRAATPRPMLVTLPYSHYVELARWALQRSNAPFVECALPVGPHASVAGLLRLCFKGGLGSATSFPGADQDAAKTNFFVRFQLRHSWVRRLAGVPCFITAEGVMLPDSWSVLAHCGFAIDDATRDYYDGVLGPAVRRFGYFHVFRRPDAYRRLQSCGPLLMAVFDAFECTLQISRRWMPQLMGIDARGAASAEKTLREAFAVASAVLEAHRFLGRGGGSEIFGGADLAFCALTGWALQPLPQYHAGRVRLFDVGEFPARFRDVTHELRATRAGRHVIDMYANYRGYEAKEAK